MLGFGGYPQAPAKEGCALSGLSRPDGCSTVLRPISWGRMACARAPSRRPLTPLTGSGPVGFGGIPKPPPKRAAPSLDSPAPDGSSAVLRPISWGAWPRARVRFRRPPTPLTGSGTGGGTPKPPPKRAAPSLDSPARMGVLPSSDPSRGGAWPYARARSPTPIGRRAMPPSRDSGAGSLEYPQRRC